MKRPVITFACLACLAGAGTAAVRASGEVRAGFSPEEARALRAARVLMIGVDDRAGQRVPPDVVIPATFVRAARDAFGLTAPSGQMPSGLSEEQTYATWAQQYFSATELADPETSDPDAIYGSDGMTNLLKYALGLDPKRDGSAELPVTDGLDGDWVHTFRASAAASDVVWRVEASIDLERWTADGVTLEPISLEGGKVVWQAHYQAPSSEPVIFRLMPQLKG
jgi:hypothetical protein